MIRQVCSETFALPPGNRREILRYAGVRSDTPEILPLLEDVWEEVTPYLTGKVCWLECSIAESDGILDLGFLKTGSEALKRNLSGCDRAILFGATIGLFPDRLTARYGSISPVRALMVQAIGAERIEGLCDVFSEKIRREAEASGLRTAPRFSPGYGDFPLSAQKDIFRALDCSRKIGLTLNDSLLMSPTKSVTAIIGIGPCAGPGPAHRCSSCSKADCAYRRVL